MSVQTETAGAAGQPQRNFLGHPPGLFVLFFTEMWERFSFYGMRAILYLFMTTAAGGLGMSPNEAGPIYAMYTSLVYLVAIPGGWLADNFLGQRKSVLYGGIVIMAGHICLAMHGLPFFYCGLGLVIAGTCLLKPNISVIVGQLYGPKDIRRDSGFSIFYMGINTGAFLAPFVCGFLAQDERFKKILESYGLDPANSWHWGFGAAAVGMFFGLMQYVLTGRHLGRAGLHPSAPRDPQTVTRNRKWLAGGVVCLAIVAALIAGIAYWWPETITKDSINNAYAISLFAVVALVFAKLFLTGDWTKAERARLTVIFVLFCAASVFWGVFEQAGSTLSLFADERSDNRVLGFSFASSWWQSVNPILIVLLTPLFSWLWIRLGKNNPSYPTKFAVALVFVGLGFLWVAGGAFASEGGGKVGIQWLFGVYLLHTIGELCLSPVGLSSMTKLAPTRVASMMMGVWFLAASVGNFLAGSASRLYEKKPEPGTDLGAEAAVALAIPLSQLLMWIGVSALIVAAVLFALVPAIKRMMTAGGVTSTGEPTA